MTKSYITGVKESKEQLSIVISEDIVGEDYGLNLSFTGVCAAGQSDAMVGINVAVVPSGDGANWVSAFFGKVNVVAAAPGPVSGYFCGAEFEVNITGTQPCAYGVLVLNSNADNSTYGQHEEYIWLREYGDKAVRGLFWFADHSRASASDDVICSQVALGPFDTAFRCVVGTTPVWLLGSTTGPETLADMKLLGSSASNYFEWDQSGDVLSLIFAAITGSSVHDALDIQVTTDNTYGEYLTYSGGVGSSMLKLTGVASMASGVFEGIDIKIATSGVFSADQDGVIGLKCVVTNTAGLTDGNIYGGQFIAKHNHSSNVMLASASLIGLEAWAYISDDGPARTCIGGNFGWHNECTGAYGAGSVIRGIQIFCDNASGAEVPVESTGLCIWNMAGTITNAINIVTSGDGFTYFLQATDDGTPAQSTSSSVTNLGTRGWIKVRIGTATRYISLGDGVS